MNNFSEIATSTNSTDTLIEDDNFTFDLIQTEINEDGKTVFDVNFTLQMVFVGYDESVTDLELIEDQLEHKFEVLPDYYGLDYVINYYIDYDMVFADATYTQNVETFASNNAVLTTTSKINETALLLQANDGIARSIFLEQDGYALNGTVVDEWFALNPYVSEPVNGYSIYLLNLTTFDSVDHSIEHWFEFNDVNIDSNQTIEWFRNEWDNALNPGVKFPYPGFDSKFANRYILDPSSYQWYSRWQILWYYGAKLVTPYGYSFQDLDDLQRNYTLSSQPEALAFYLDEYLYGILTLIFRDGYLGNPNYIDVDSISVQTLVLNGNEIYNKPIEDTTWITSEERIYNQLNGPAPFFNWDIDVNFANLSEYPIIEQVFLDSLLPTSVPGFWEIDSITLWDNLINRRHLFFDLDAADQVVTSIVLVRDNMVLKVGLNNYTGMGGNNNVVVLKAGERFFEEDGLTPRSGVTEVLIHEIGHVLGFGHPGGGGSYCRGTMTYYNTREEFNSFYIDTMRRGMVEMRYCEVLLQAQNDLARFGVGPFSPEVTTVLVDLNNALDQTLLYHDQMEYLLAIDEVNIAREKMDLLEALRTAEFGQIRNIGSDPRGYSESIFVQDSIAYSPCGSELLLFDVSDPTIPTLLSSCDLPGFCMDVYVYEGYAYLSGIENGFTIINVSDSLSPQVVSVVEEEGLVTDVHVEGHLAFVSKISVDSSGPALKIYDISEPANPILIDTLCYDMDIRRVISAGDYFYAYAHAKFSNGTTHSAIFVFEKVNDYYFVQTDYYIESLGKISTFELYFQDDKLYLCQARSDGEYLTIFDVSDSHNIALITRIAVGGVPVDCHIVGTYAYLTCYDYALTVIDLTTNTIVTFFEMEGIPVGVFVVGSTAFIASYSNLAFVDVSNPFLPVELAYYDLEPGYCNNFAMKDDYLFISDSSLGVAIMDISDPTNPVLASHIVIFDGSMDVKIDGNYLFVTSTPNRFNIYDITLPTAPVKLGSYNLTNPCYQFAIQGDFAFIPNRDRFSILDISDKYNPIEISFVTTPSYTQGVFIQNSIAYINCEGYGMQIVDITDVYSPTTISTIDFEETVYELIVANDIVYIGHAYGIIVVDISDLANPNVAFNFTVKNCNIHDFAIKDNRLYTAEGENGIHIYDVSDPNKIVEIGFNTTIISANHIDYENGLIIVTQSRDGISFFDHDLDHDGLFSIDEIAFGSDPFLYDTDADGYSDYEEWLAGTDPNDPLSYPGKIKTIIIGSAIFGGSIATGIVITIVVTRKRKTA